MTTRLTRTALELAAPRVLAIEDRAVLASSSGANLLPRARPPGPPFFYPFADPMA